MEYQNKIFAATIKNDSRPRSVTFFSRIGLDRFVICD